MANFRKFTCSSQFVPDTSVSASIGFTRIPVRNAVRPSSRIETIAHEYLVDRDGSRHQPMNGLVHYCKRIPQDRGHSHPVTNPAGRTHHLSLGSASPVGTATRYFATGDRGWSPDTFRPTPGDVGDIDSRPIQSGDFRVPPEGEA